MVHHWVDDTCSVRDAAGSAESAEGEIYSAPREKSLGRGRFRANDPRKSLNETPTDIADRQTGKEKSANWWRINGGGAGLQEEIASCDFSVAIIDRFLKKVFYFITNNRYWLSISR